MEELSVAAPMPRAWPGASDEAVAISATRLLAAPEGVDADECLSRFAGLLENAEKLTGKVVANRHTWRASDSEWTFLLLLAYLNEVELPGAVANSADAALGFLIGAKFGLETTQRILRELPRTER
jgi:hypothetical protein